jgi:hypothetical protein
MVKTHLLKKKRTYKFKRINNKSKKANKIHRSKSKKIQGGNLQNNNKIHEINELISKYDNVIALDNIDTDHSFIFDKFNQYLSENQTCSKLFIRFLAKILRENVVYISNLDMLKKIRTNAKLLLESYSSNYSIVIIDPLKEKKSNSFYTLLFIKEYNNLASLSKDKKKIQYFYRSFEYIDLFFDTKKDTYIPKFKENFVFVFSDDFSYSGSQLQNQINYNDEIKIDLSLHKNYIYFLNLYGITCQAKRKIDQSFLRPNIIYPQEFCSKWKDVLSKYAKESNLTNEELIYQNDMFIAYSSKVITNPIYKNTTLTNSVKYKNDIYIESQIYKYFANSENLTFIYLFSKFPDILSTIPTMCKFYSYNEKNVILEQNNFIDRNSILGKETFYFTDVVPSSNYQGIINLINSNKEETVFYKCSRLRDDTLLSESQQNDQDIITISNPIMKHNCEATIEPFYKNLNFHFDTISST